MWQSGVGFVRCAKNAGIPKLPKDHELLHMLRRVPMNGNPNTYDCFYDESLNRTLSQIASAAYSAHWELRIFSYWLELQNLRARQSSGSGQV